ncbi:hypothetical protein LTR37_008215 [Vermiconidia calcicola]|uniref:Uncharacterized protein n=1 Tax=Vermiconidia calcicola TaxID=1690605 RepID=A0ACC3NBZ6_9PEZI|nr:hypothetical protein LTR37_008215 [Vermiconidia calcicola]
MDNYGNKYYENLDEELPLRTRWVDYKDKEFDAYVYWVANRAGLVFNMGASLSVNVRADYRRHAWMSYMVDKPPSEDKLMQRMQRPWEPKKHLPTMTGSKSEFKTYSTYVQGYSSWAWLSY